MRPGASAPSQRYRSIRRLTDSEFCWRGLLGGKAGAHSSLLATHIERVEKRAQPSAGHEPKTVGDLPPRQPAQQQFPVRPHRVEGSPSEHYCPLMSVCLVAEYPWPQIRHLRGLEEPGVVVLSDTRLSSPDGRPWTPWVVAKQGAVERNIFVCYTSSHVGVTIRALSATVSRRDVKRVGAALRELHQRHGGATELLVVVWRRRQRPQVLEVMPPGYAPRKRTGVVGIGDRAVLEWIRENLPDVAETERQQKFVESFRGRMPGIQVPEPRYGIDQAAMQLVAAMYEGITQAGGSTVGLPVQLALVHRGEVRVENVAMTADLTTWEEVAILPHQLKMPKLQLVRMAEDNAKRTAVQIFDA